MTILESMYPKRDFFGQLNHILDFQINDLKRSLQLAKANFLVAQGCMNTIEFLGGIRNGELGMKRKVESRFREGISLLGNRNGVRLLSDLTRAAGADVMWALRCGLTHQYLPNVDTINGIFIGAGDAPGSKYDTVGEIERAEGRVGVKGPLILVDTIALFRAIEAGRKKLIDELEADDTKRVRAEKALFRLPELL